MMSDDIDIEEHDVMQNAKEFYPDISIVKTESLDYDDDDDQDISYPGLHPNPGPIVESGLVEVHNADSTTEIQERPSTSLAPTPPDGQFFGNKIILGFKKKTPDDEIHHEPRCFQTRLRLKDCMPMLNNSRRYCFKCQTLFPTPNLMYSHEMNTHSHLIEMDESSVSTEMSKPEYFSCKLCPSKFTRQFNLSKHYKFKHSNAPKESKDVCFVCHKPQASKEALIKHLYENHYNNKTYSCQICSDQFKNKEDLEEHLYEHAKIKFKQKMQNSESTPNPNNQYKCTICELTFPSKYSLRAHLNSYHNKKATNARKLQIAARETNFFFKCSMCLKAFSKMISARKHFMQSHKGMPLTNCFRKCVYRKPSPSTTQSTDQSTDLIEKPPQHMLNKHIIGNTIKKAFNQSPSVSTDQSQVTEKPAQHLIPKNVIFKCHTCPLCFLNNKDALDHKRHKVIFDSCEKCHLCFPNDLMKLHKMQHASASKFQVISAFPNLRKRLLCKCPQCDVYFMETSLFCHLYYCKRNTKSFYCHICHLNVHHKFRENHLKDHAEFNKASDFIFVEYINPTSDTDDGLDEDEMPNEQDDLMERYKSLSTIWNVLYKCIICSFVVDNYTMVVEHCHDHFVKGSNLEKAITNCKTCGIDFEKISYGRHSKLHKSNNQVNGASFNVLSYNYTDFYKNTWRNLFSGIPEHDVQRLIRDSPYKSIRTIKLRMVTSGSSEYTLYKCEQCKNVVQEKFVVNHALKLHDAPFKRALISCTHKCNECHLQFGGHVNWSKHQEMHKKFKIGVNFFTLTSFNSTGDFRYNKMLKASHVHVPSDDVVMHKCQKCDFATEFLATIVAHASEDCANKINDYKPCANCQLMFDKKEFFSHISRHKQPDYCIENFKISVFTAKSNSPESTEHVLYQCSKCKKCSRKENRLRIHSCQSPTCACKKCNLKFSKNVYPMHMMDHLALPRYTIDNIRVIPYNPDSIDRVVKTPSPAPVRVSKTKYVLYQCKICSMNVVSKGSAFRHCRQYCCSSNYNNRYTCPKCSLIFFHGQKASHVRMHLSHPNFNRQTIKIHYFDQHSLETLGTRSLKTDAKVVPEPDLPDSEVLIRTPARGRSKPYMFFHCQKCFVVYTTRGSALKHTKRCKGKVSKAFCPICEYPMYPKRISNHLNAHKKFPDMTRDNIEIFKFTDRLSLRVRPKVARISASPKPKVTKTSASPKPKVTKTSASPKPKSKSPIPYDSAHLSAYKYKIYQCTRCNICFHNRGFINRHHVLNCNRRPRKQCTICGLSFAAKSLKQNKSHMIMHKQPDFTLENIIIIPFANGVVNHKKAYPAKFGKKNRPIAAEIESDQSDGATEFDDYSKAIYNCKVCAAYFPTKREALKHSEIKHSQCVIKSKSNCEICGFDFPRTVLLKHIQFHHTISGFNTDDFEVLPLKSSSINAEAPKDNISDNDTITLDESTDEQFNVDDWKQLYKCSVCQVLFIKVNTLNRHCSDKHTKCVIVNIKHCPQCDLPFTHHSLKKHIEIHHDRFNLSSDDFTILEGSPSNGRSASEKDFLTNLRVVSRDPLDINADDQQDTELAEPSNIKSFIVTAVESDEAELSVQ